MKRPRQASRSSIEEARRDSDVAREPGETFGAWLTVDEVRRYIGSSSRAAVYTWLRRHALVLHGRLVAKVDIDRAFKVMRRQRRRMHPNSLKNLRRSA